MPRKTKAERDDARINALSFASQIPDLARERAALAAYYAMRALPVDVDDDDASDTAGATEAGRSND